MLQHFPSVGQCEKRASGEISGKKGSKFRGKFDVKHPNQLVDVLHHRQVAFCKIPEFCWYFGGIFDAD